MKRNNIIVFGILVGFFVFSCASSPKENSPKESPPKESRPTVENPYRPLSEVPGANVIGTVFLSSEEELGVYGSDVISKINTAVYTALLKKAREQYGDGHIDVADITWVNIRYDSYEASGKVVSIGGGNRISTAGGIEGAIERAAADVAESFSARSRIAIVYITAEDRSSMDFIAGELEHLLRRKGFVIIDRSELDRIRTEQRFGLSGEVDDRTAASIGNFAGANIVITGRVDGEGNLRRLRLRALDTTNAQVVGTASERL